MRYLGNAKSNSHEVFCFLLVFWSFFQIIGDVSRPFPPPLYRTKRTERAYKYRELRLFGALGIITNVKKLLKGLPNFLLGINNKDRKGIKVQGIEAFWGLRNNHKNSRNYCNL